LGRAYINLWRLAYQKGSLTLSVEGRGDTDVIRVWSTELTIQGTATDPMFIAEIREAADG
jgi:hypothetical protein